MSEDARAWPVNGGLSSRHTPIKLGAGVCERERDRGKERGREIIAARGVSQKRIKQARAPQFTHISRAGSLDIWRKRQCRFHVHHG